VEGKLKGGTKEKFKKGVPQQGEKKNREQHLTKIDRTTTVRKKTVSLHSTKKRGKIPVVQSIGVEKREGGGVRKSEAGCLLKKAAGRGTNPA